MNALKRATAAGYLNRIETYRGWMPATRRGKRLLDVGSGLGNMLAEAPERWYVVTGVEYAEASVARVNARLGAQVVVQGTVESAHLRGEPFDVCVFADVIEHTRDPLAVVVRAWELLAPQGTLFVAAPSLDSWSARLMRQAFVLGAQHGLDGKTWKLRHFADELLVSQVMNFGHQFYTTLFNVVYGQRLRHPFTMYKVFRRDCVYGLTFESNRFDFDWELLGKLVRVGYVPLTSGWAVSRATRDEARRIAIWGLTYKPGTDTLRRPGAVELCRWLTSTGATVRVTMRLPASFLPI